jgi:Ni/Fe-hydrogenase subunit HybB-like protein
VYVIAAMFLILAAFGVGFGLLFLLDQSLDGKVMDWLDDPSSSLKNIVAALVSIICVVIGVMAVYKFTDLLGL